MEKGGAGVLGSRGGLIKQKCRYNKEVGRKYFLKGTEKIMKARTRVHRKAPTQPPSPPPLCYLQQKAPRP